MTRLAIFLGSIAWTGFFPIAPATFSTLILALIFWWWAPGPQALAVLLLVSLVVSVPVADRMAKALGKDPGACTIDELVGFVIALQGRNLADPGSWKIIAAAFFLFRFFDILKIWPANRLEALPGGWGIVADDAMAGIYSLAALFVLATWLI